ncbi:N-acetyltransferase [Roseibium denhamense]|uniref:Acetyltransferase (GNAT) domain-containing protein n=1 Tax=Roseibium denhamense TaxID=76305 RepID=A0ABY1PD28_9HYPH|nr:GNAT family N-acetyltransferase [Roseibium denhamense]MTI04584.1 N-acetyltransferase [Roseibium denhamense]SMP31165.1 Acetyltransferase (GNAT) domain-containing protein [Roseibium denhamense]
MIELKPQVPDVDTYLRLRSECGLSGYAPEAAEIGLSNSLYCVMLFDEGDAIGMGRLIGDGGCFIQVTDIAVLPAYQGQGLGKRVMKALSNYLEMSLPGSAYVSLIADGQAKDLYAQYGFQETAPKSVGMARRAGRRTGN